MSETTKLLRTPLLEIAYEERGEEDATPIILTHGFPDDVRTWDAVAPALAGAGFRVFMPYQRGYGQTRFLKSKTPRTGQVTAQGQDVIDFADALGLERLHLIGHDWGARAAFVVAALAPERLYSIVTLAAGYEESDPLKHVAYSQSSE